MTTVSEHAARLSNIRNLLSTAASAAQCARFGTNPVTLDKALGHLIGEVDDAVDALHGFCFADQDDARGIRELHALTLAAQHCKQGDHAAAVDVLAEVFTAPLKAVS